jgi:hypothetical protein
MLINRREETEEGQMGAQNALVLNNQMYAILDHHRILYNLWAFNWLIRQKYQIGPVFRNTCNISRVLIGTHGLVLTSCWVPV